jgi:hypothetical protein
MNRTEVPAEFKSQPGASTKQLDFLTSLAEGREMPEESRQRLLDKIAVQRKANEERGDRAVEPTGLTLERASDFIARLKEKPRRQDNPGNPVGQIHVKYEEHELDDGKSHRIGYVIGAGPHRVPRGRYAIDTTGDRFVNDTSFFKVAVGDRGGWWINIQVSDEFHDITNWDNKRWVIQQIAKDPEAAMRAYGKEFERCGMCGRGLTNDLSRELGIGPVCRTRL